MNRLWIIAFLAIGCSQPTPPKPADTASNLKDTFDSSPDRAYGRRILACLDAFDDVSNTSQTMSDADMEHYSLTKKVPVELINRMKIGVREEDKAIATVKELSPPKQFQAFHKEVIKGFEQRRASLNSLIPAVEKMDRKKIQSVLDEAESQGKARRAEMDKILGGKTAEAFLGLK